MSDTIGIKIGIDGEKEFKNALTAINAQLKTFSAEMYSSVTSMTGMADKETLVANKSEILTKQIAATQQKIELLGGEYERQKTHLSELGTALEQAKQKYGEQSEEAVKAENAYNRQAAAVSKLSAQMNTAKGDLNQYTNEMDNVADSMDGASESGTRLGDIIKGSVISQTIIDGVKQLASAFVGFAKKGVELASDLEEVQNVVDVTFGDGADEVNSFAKSAAASFGLSELQAKQFTGTMGAMFTSMGLGETDVKNMSMSLAGLAADMGSFYNLDAETAFEKLRAGISGETEPLKQLGINMSVANLEAYALSQGIDKAYSSMSEAEKATLRYNYLMSATANAQGDFSRTSDSYANQQKILELNMQNLAATVGTAVLPTLTGLTTWLNDFLAGTSSFNIDTLIAGIKAAIPVVTGLTAAFVAYKAALGISTLIDTVKTALEGQRVATVAAELAQKLLNSTMLANPFVLVATLLAGLSAALVTAYNTSEEFREKVNAAFGAVKNVVDTVVTAIKNGWEGIRTAWGNAVDFFTEIKDGIANAFSNLVNTAVNWGKDLLDNFISGIKSKIKALTDTVKNVAGKVKSFLGFSEPEEGPLSNFHTYAPDMMDLYAKGIRENTGKVESAVSSVAGVIKSAMMGASLGNVTKNLDAGVVANMKRPSDAATASSIYKATEAAVNGISAGGAASVQTIIVQTVLNGKVIAEELIDPLKNVADQRGYLHA